MAFGQACNCPPVNECATCTGGITNLTIQYNGTKPALIRAEDKSEVIFQETLNPGSVFSVSGSNPQGKFKGNELQLFIDGLFNVEVDVDCKLDVGPNSVYGSFVIVGGKNRQGETLCCVETLDNVAPTLAGCPANIVLPLLSGCTRAVSWTPPNATDCNLKSLTSNRNPGDVFPAGTTTVTYTATDFANNVSTCSFSVTIKDEIFPVFTNCPSTVIVNANSSCGAIVNWTPPIATDNCGSVDVTASRSPGSTFLLGATTVIYEAEDESGNKTMCSFTVVVQDQTSPTMVNCPANIIVDATSGCSVIVNWTPPTVNDNCGNASFTASPPNPGSAFAVGLHTLTYVAKDAAGNETSCSFTVTVRDVTAPTIQQCPGNISINATSSCGANVSWTPPTAIDLCGVTSFLPSHAPNSTFGVGTTTVSYTAEDAAGNRSTCSFQITVTDNVPPVISNCPANIIVDATPGCSTVVNWTPPTVNDNCGSASFTASPPNPRSAFAVGLHTLTYVAKDGAGNEAVCSFTITVQDKSKPLLSNCPVDIRITASGNCQAQVNWSPPNATDNCSVTVQASHDPNSFFNFGTTAVTYSAEDPAGNKVTCSFNITVVDDVAPVFTNCPSDIVINATASCQASVTWTPPMVTDNCSALVTSNFNPGDFFSLGVTDVIYVAIDGSGNRTTCTFKVTVEDQSAPVFTSCVSEVKALSDECEMPVFWNEPQVTDNCTYAITRTHKPGNIFPLGITDVSYTATDDMGNSSSCSIRVIVEYNLPPVLEGCPDDITISTSYSKPVAVSWVEPVIDKKCVIAQYSSNHRTGDLFGIGTTEVTYEAKVDQRTATCSFKVIVFDEDQDLSVMQLITPDGNGVNDGWVIGNIERYQDNEVIIVDRWGSIIYNVTKYDNASKMWNGSNLRGEPVPTGTYFYTISFRSGPEMIKKTGFIELIR